jgi:predicted dinucleotide-binding enzyme
VPWARVPEAVQGLEWNGQIVIDATNDFAPSDLDGRTSSERIAGLVGGEIRQLRGPLAGINLIRLP